MGAIYGITGSLALTANTANQVICGVVSAGATSDAVITWLDITMDAVTPAQGVKAELVRYASGPPTATTYTPNKLSAAAQSVAASFIAWIPPITVTPGTAVPVKTWYLPPTGGVLIQWPLSREEYLIPGSNVWTGVRLSTTSGVSPNAAFNLSWSELYMSGYKPVGVELLYSFFGAATVTTPTTSPGSSMILTYPPIIIPAGYFDKVGSWSSSLKLEMGGLMTTTATVPTWQFFLYAAQLANPPVFSAALTLGSTATFTPSTVSANTTWVATINIGLRTLALGAGSTVIAVGSYLSPAVSVATYAAPDMAMMPGPGAYTPFATYDTSQSYTLWPALSLGAATAGNTTTTQYVKLYGES